MQGLLPRRPDQDRLAADGGAQETVPDPVNSLPRKTLNALYPPCPETVLNDFVAVSRFHLTHPFYQNLMVKPIF